MNCLPWLSRLFFLISFAVFLSLTTATSHDQEFQRYDGWYNNKNHLSYGSVKSPLIYKAGTAYSDGIYSPTGRKRPEPGLISMNLMRKSDGLAPYRNLTAFFAFFGQVVSGEIIATIASGNIACPAEMMPFKIYRPACAGDNCSTEKESVSNMMPFFRVAFDPSTGHHLNNPRRPINFATTWIDGSFVYGQITPWVDSLREFSGGRLRSLQPDDKFPEKNFLRIPILNPPPPADHPSLLNPERLYALGSQKGNQHPPLLVIGIVLHRYHNWLANWLRESHPEFSEEDIFQRSRRWLIATMQSVIMYEFLPLFIGRDLPKYTGYNSTVDPSISVEFQAAAYRFGHSLLPSGFYLRDATCQFTAVPFCRVWWDGSNLVEIVGLEPIIRGLTSQKMERGDHIFSEGLREKLFGGMRLTQGDLAATNIMRGREVGLADYNTVRAAYGLPRIRRWRDVNPWLYLSDPEVIDKAAEMYNNSTDDVDLYVAGLLESIPDGPGETFQAILIDQFRRIRDADRFWFENRDNRLFTEAEIDRLKSVRLAEVIANVTEISLVELTDSVFVYGEQTFCSQPVQLNAKLLAPCSEPESYDFFTGSEATFVVSFVVLGLVPLVVWLIAWIISFYRSRMFRVSNTYMSFRSTKRLQGTFLAYEYLNPNVQKRVQVRVGSANDPVLEIMCRLAQHIRTIRFENIEKVEFWLNSDNDKQPLFVLHVPKEYDLILVYSDVKYRYGFLSAFEKFLADIGIEFDKKVLSTSEVMRRATTLSQRRTMLEDFFSSAFRKVFAAKKKLGERVSFVLPERVNSIRNCRKKTKDVSDSELNKIEFAEALQLTPDSFFVQQMFALADKDRNGYISFSEFVDVLTLLSKGSLEDKMKLLFEMYDVDNSNDLDSTEFSEMIRSLLDVANRNVKDEEIEGIVRGIFKESGLKIKNNIDLQDFLALVERNQSALWNDLTMESYGLTESERIVSPAKNRREVVTLVNTPEKSWFTRKYNRVTCYLENNWNYIVLTTAFVLVSCLLFADYFVLYGFFKEHKGLRKSVGHGASVSRGAAHALSFSYALMLLAVCRNLMAALRNTSLNYYIPVDFAIDFHRFVAVFALILTVIHIIGHGINFYQISTQSLPILQCLVPEIHIETDFLPKFHFWLYATVPGITGVLLVVVLSVMYVFATAWARRNIYKAFWLTHRLYIVVFALTIIHGSFGLLQHPIFPYYIIGPAILYVIDWIITLRRRSIVLRIETVEALPSEVLHLSFKCPRSIRFLSGEWIGLCCDELSTEEFHPFTITSAPHEQLISLHIRVVGPWTKKLYDLFSGRIANHLPFPKIKMSGPYGGRHQDWLKFEAVVLVGAGIGVTPTASVLKDLVHKVYQLNKEIHCRRVYFVWLSRTQQQFEWFLDILKYVENEDVHGLIQIDIFITQMIKNFDIRTTMLYICEHQFQRLSRQSFFTGLKGKTHFGRIDFHEYLAGVMRAISGQVSKVGVFCCGPKSVSRSLDAACQKLNQTMSGPRLIAHHETF